jgi:arylsulfatase A-like enzyme
VNKFAVVLIALFVVLGVSYALLLPSRRPNVVLIIIDTLRADKLGSYGFPAAASREIDQIASSGILFERVISQSSWTRSSHGSFLTSLYPRTIGIYKERWDALREEFTTLAEALKSGGYYTLGFTANPNINSVFNFNQGFDKYVDSRVIFNWMTPKEGQSKAGKGGGFPRASEIFQMALDEAKQAPSSPVYIQINVMEVHGSHKVRNREIDDDLRKYGEAKYLQTIRNVSREVGKFVHEIKNMPGWEDALFVITSDHGEGLKDHVDVAASTRHGNLLYESQVNVPLIFQRDGGRMESGRRIGNMVRLLDLMPTVLDCVHVDIPKQVAGLSLLDLMQGQSSASSVHPKYAIAETNWRQVDKSAIYGSDWAFIENRDEWSGVNPKELQKIGTPSNGVLTDKIESQPGVAEDLEKRLASWEHDHPRATAVGPKNKLFASEIEQLKSLGYLQ